MEELLSLYKDEFPHPSFLPAEYCSGIDLGIGVPLFLTRWSPLPFISSLFKFDNFLCSSIEQSLIIIIMAVTNILTVIATVGNILNICSWVNMFYFETRCFSSVTVRRDGGKFVENFSTIKKLLGAFSKTSVRQRTGELGSTQLSELRLGEFSIRSRRFYEIEFRTDKITYSKP